MNPNQSNAAVLTDKTNSDSPHQRVSRKNSTLVENRAQIRAAFSAIHDGDLARLSAIVRTKRQANWLSPSRLGWSLLDAAVAKRAASTVEFLLSKGADPNTLFRGRIRVRVAVEDGEYWSPLFRAILYQDAEIVSLFLDAGASLNLPQKVDFHAGDDDCQVWFDILKLGPAVAALREARALSRSVDGPTVICGRRVDKCSRL